MKNRVVTVAILAGVVIAGVTFLGAARMSGDDTTKGKDASKTLSPVKSGSKGVVVFGNIDLDNGVGLVSLYPEMFPQPCKVKDVFVAEGATVVKDQKLCDFDPELTDLTVKEAKAGLEQARAAEARANGAMAAANQALEAHQVGIQVTQLTVEGKQKELEAAKVELDELRNKLGKIGGGNDPELRSAQNKIDAAAKALAAEDAKLEGLRRIQPTSKKAEAQGAIDEAKAAVAKQQIILDKAEYAQKLLVLTAPSDGKIVRSLVSRGMTFGPQSRQPAFLFQPKGPMIVRAEVDQEFATRVEVGLDAVITDDGNPNLRWTGKVIRVADSFLPKRSSAGVPEGLSLNETRVLECVVSVDGVDPSAPIRVGQRVKVAIGVE